MHFVMSSIDLALQSLSTLPKTLLLPGNEEIQVISCIPSKLPPIVPPIIAPPLTPRTPRRHLTVDEPLRSPRTPIRKKKGTKRANTSALEMNAFEFIRITMLGLLLSKFEKRCLPLQSVKYIMLYHIELRLNRSFANVILSLILQNENNLSDI